MFQKSALLISHKQLFTEGRAVNKFLVVKIYSSLTFFNDEKKQATQKRRLYYKR